MKTMISKNICVMGTAMLFLWVLTTSPLAARGGYMKGGHGDGLFQIERIANELELTDEQRAEFERIESNGREAARSHVQDMIEVRKAMQQLLDADTFDEAAVRSLASRKSASMMELTIIRARKRFEFKSLLTSEQKEKLNHMHERRDFHP